MASGEPKMTAPVSLDRRMEAEFNPSENKSSYHHIAHGFISARYSIRAVGLAAAISMLFGIISTSLLNRTDRSDQTIVCLTPLPEVEVNGYIVTPQSSTKGIEQ